MDNVFYFRKISVIGGTEQFLYEIAKMYHNYDITIFYDSADKYQLRRLKKFVRCEKRTGKLVKCKRAFFNFNLDMINEIEAEEYYFVSHANYEELGYKPPIENSKLTNFVGVSKFSATKLDEYGLKLGKNIHTIPCYNPLTLEEPKKVPILVSACRLNDKVKGGQRTVQLINALDNYCRRYGRNYLWLIFTNHTDLILPSPNVVYLQPRVDVRPYIAMADYVLQLSNDMETYCYTINEALGYGVPVVTTPLSICKELPIDENMRIELAFDCSNADDVARQIFEKPVTKFKYKIPKSDWDKLLVPGNSTYNYEPVIVMATKKYFDLELNEHIKVGMTWETSKERAELLVEKNCAEILSEENDNA